MINKQDYYSDDILKKMTRYTFSREVAFVSKDKSDYPIRFMRVGYPSNWKFAFKNTSFFKKNYSIYMSTTFYDKYPKISFHPAIRQRQLDEWRVSQYEHVKGQDFFIDVDVLSQSCEDKNIRDLCYDLDVFGYKFNLPYQIRYSGKGLHFVIPYDYFKSLGKDLDPRNENNLYDFYKELCVDIKFYFDWDFIDTTVNTFGRLFKVPYSLADYCGDLRVVKILGNSLCRSNHNYSKCEDFIEAILK